MPFVEFSLYRHGHVSLNDQEDLVLGQCLDAPLDDLGLRQAPSLGGYQRRLGLYPDRVYSSPAERALATAELALGVLGVSGHLPIIKDYGLVEQSLGEHEGMPRSQVYTPSLKEQIELEGADYRHPGGESMRDVSDRMLASLTRFAEDANHLGLRRVDGYSHNTAIASVLSQIDGVVESREMRNYVRTLLRERRIGNVSRTVVVWEKGRFTIKSVGEPTVAID